MARGTFSESVWPITKHRISGNWLKGEQCKTGRRILTIYTSYDVLLHKKVPFWGSHCNCSTFWTWSPPKISNWGVIGHFLAKLVKYQHLHTIETNTSIPTTFCPVTKPPNVCRWWSKHAQNKFKMADGRKTIRTRTQQLLSQKSKGHRANFWNCGKFMKFGGFPPPQKKKMPERNTVR